MSQGPFGDPPPPVQLHRRRGWSVALLAVAAALVWFVLRPASSHVHDAPRRIPWPLPDASQAAAAHTILPDGRIYLAIEHLPLPESGLPFAAWHEHEGRVPY